MHYYYYHHHHYLLLSLVECRLVSYIGGGVGGGGKCREEANSGNSKFVASHPSSLLLSPSFLPTWLNPLAILSEAETCDKTTLSLSFLHNHK